MVDLFVQALKKAGKNPTTDKLYDSFLTIKKSAGGVHVERRGRVREDQDLLRQPGAPRGPEPGDHADRQGRQRASTTAARHR